MNTKNYRIFDDLYKNIMMKALMRHIIYLCVGQNFRNSLLKKWLPKNERFEFHCRFTIKYLINKKNFFFCNIFGIFEIFDILF